MQHKSNKNLSIAEVFSGVKHKLDEFVFYTSYFCSIFLPFHREREGTRYFASEKAQKYSQRKHGRVTSFG